MNDSAVPMSPEAPVATTWPSIRSSGIKFIRYAGNDDGNWLGSSGVPSGFGWGRKDSITASSLAVAGEKDKVIFLPASCGMPVEYVRPALAPVGSGRLKLIVSRRVSGICANDAPTSTVL